MILPLFKERVPYQFETMLDGDVYTFELHYNPDYDFFTVDISRHGEVILYGEKITYGQPLFRHITDYRLPNVDIVPLDPSNEENKATYDTIEESVYLYVRDGDV